MENNKYIETEEYQIIFGDAGNQLNSYVNSCEYSQVFLLVDEHTEKDCLNKIEAELNFEYKSYQIKSGEENKTIHTAQEIWNSMISEGLDRHSLMINIGGGVIGDMGGFCASTYMRGIDFVQVPTTLLAQVDASVGGKLAIDMDAYKNIIGLFNNPKQVIIDSSFLNTLPKREVMSGYAELLKHGLIKDKDLWNDLLDFDTNSMDSWQSLIYTSVFIKRDIIEEDPYEKGLRKILNFGHTIGHAIESELLGTKDQLTHGEAIIIGMICESKISVTRGLMSQEVCDQIRDSLLSIYPHLLSNIPLTSKLLGRMKLDKKNISGIINFTLLDAIGSSIFDQSATSQEIEDSINYYTICK